MINLLPPVLVYLWEMGEELLQEFGYLRPLKNFLQNNEYNLWMVVAGFLLLGILVQICLTVYLCYVIARPYFVERRARRERELLHKIRREMVHEKIN